MKKFLALNRGEIAIRIMRAATELGLRTVAIFSKEDRLSLHRFKADEAYMVGEGLGPYRHISIWTGLLRSPWRRVWTLSTRATASFRRTLPCPACERAGITFVGPSTRILELLGDKTAARRLAQSAGIPVIPGTEQPVSDPDEAKRSAGEIGFPLMVKAAFGGGGRGMRMVRSAAQHEARLAEASREAARPSATAGVFLERYIRRARHIEVQILGDRQRLPAPL